MKLDVRSSWTDGSNKSKIYLDPFGSNIESLFLRDSICTTISVERVWSDIHTTAEWGRLPEDPNGITRPALTEDDRSVRDWFCSQATQLGCEVRIDEMGNIFAILPGEEPDVPAIGIGSHLDTQPAGGRFDGILGVVGGLEVIRAIKASGKATFAPIAVIDWTNEEGARYSSGCTGSAVWSKHVELDIGHGNRNLSTGRSLADDLRDINYFGSWPASHELNPLSAHFELHIEQGRRLENVRKTIGVVDSVQGIRWFTVKIRGRQAHAGSTPVAQRADAVVAASKLIIFLESLAIETEVFATVGVIEVDNGSSNVVSGSTSCTIDLRHPSEELLDQVEERIRGQMCNLSTANGFGIEFDMERVWHSPAVRFDPKASQCVLQAARRVVGDSGIIPSIISYAGHDSALVASANIPTAMIFVPSKNGISHNPDEWTSKEECGAGVQTLYESIRAYDDYLRKKKQYAAYSPF